MIIENLNGLIRIISEDRNKITNKKREFYSDFVYLGKNDSIDNYEEVGREIWKHFVEDNDTDFDILQEKIINNNLMITNLQELLLDTDFKLMCLETENINMLATTFDLDFRVFELECLIEDSVYQMSTIESCKLNINTKEMRGNKTMALSQYEMAKKLILLGEYNREDMEYKLNRYLNRKVITQTEYDELIALIDANELLEK